MKKKKKKKDIRIFSVIKVKVYANKDTVQNHYPSITKTRLFKYIDNFTTNNPESFQIKILIFSIFLLKT